MKYEAIRTYCQEFSVGKMCQALNLTKGSYYQWLKRMKCKEDKRVKEKAIIEIIAKVFEDSRKTYGYRRMKRSLLDAGVCLSEYKIRKLMQENGMYPVVGIKYRPARNGKRTGRFMENIVKQNFSPISLNEVWAGDITYIKTALGWVYLAVVIDLYNREVIGYSISKTIDTELVKRALCNALARNNKKTGGTIFHSDRGTQYCSRGFQQMLEKHGLIGSMSRPGCPYDNACVESFFSTAKRECISRKEYVTLNEVKADLFEYIEMFYNRKRMHKTLGYKSPIEFRLLESA